MEGTLSRSTLISAVLLLPSGFMAGLLCAHVPALLLQLAFLMGLVAWFGFALCFFAAKPARSDKAHVNLCRESRAWLFWFAAHNLFWLGSTQTLIVLLLLFFGPINVMPALCAGLMAMGAIALFGLVPVRHGQMLGLCWQAPVLVGRKTFFRQAARTIFLKERFRYATLVDKSRTRPILPAMTRILDQVGIQGSTRGLALIAGHRSGFLTEWLQRFKAQLAVFWMITLLWVIVAFVAPLQDPNGSPLPWKLEPLPFLPTFITQQENPITHADQAETDDTAAVAQTEPGESNAEQARESSMSDTPGGDGQTAGDRDTTEYVRNPDVQTSTPDSSDSLSKSGDEPVNTAENRPESNSGSGSPTKTDAGESGQGMDMDGAGRGRGERQQAGQNSGSGNSPGQGNGQEGKEGPGSGSGQGSRGTDGKEPGAGEGQGQGSDGSGGQGSGEGQGQGGGEAGSNSGGNGSGSSGANGNSSGNAENTGEGSGGQPSESSGGFSSSGEGPDGKGGGGNGSGGVPAPVPGTGDIINLELPPLDQEARYRKSEDPEETTEAPDRKARGEALQSAQRNNRESTDGKADQIVPNWIKSLLAGKKEKRKDDQP